MFADDLRHSWRRLRSRPATVVAAAAMLALGIGLTTAMFTIADTLLLRPVPFRDPDRLAQVWMRSRTGGRSAVAPAVFRAWRASPAFEAVESATTGTALITTDAAPVARGSATVTSGLFEMLNVRATRGRLFLPEEGRAGSDDRVLISEDLWRSTFGADPSFIGRSLSINGRPLVVVGIFPSDFRFPRWDTMVWMPIDFDRPPPDRATDLPVAYARLAPSMPKADALRLATEAGRLADPSTSSLYADASPIAREILNPYFQRAVPILFGGVGLVFLVLCTNASSLLLVRLTERRREYTMCSALGATRWRLLRQALVESAMLGVVGAAGGLFLAWMLVTAARGLLPEAFLLRTLNPLNLDARALAATSVSGVLAILAASVLPAWIGTRLTSSDALRSGDWAGTETRTARTFARGLLVGEMALACTLLVGATLLVRSFVNLARADRGLDSEGVLVATISLPATTFKDRAARVAMTGVVETELRRLPGVQRIAVSYGLPPDGGSLHFGDDWRSDIPGAPAIDMHVESYMVGPDFFELYRIPVVRGRTFGSGDDPQDVVVGERLAARLWPGVDAVGRSFSRGREQHRVIGVAREIHHPSIDPQNDRPEFYTPVPASGIGGGYFMVSLRCAGACPESALVRQRIFATSSAIQVIDVSALDSVYLEQLAPPRAAAALGFVFATVAVLAAAGGLFGVLSYAVGRRRREFGIRAALGATRPQIRGLVLRDGLLVAMAGIGLGSAAGWSLARSLASLQYGVTAGDPVSWSVVIGLLAMITFAATWRPAHQAASVDPVTLLRDE